MLHILFTTSFPFDDILMLDTTRAEVNSESETTQNIDKTKINFNFNLLNQTINTKLPKQAKLQDKNQDNETPGRRGPSSGSFLAEDDTGYCESV